jgi:hypothetical protein
LATGAAADVVHVQRRNALFGDHLPRFFQNAPPPLDNGGAGIGLRAFAGPGGLVSVAAMCIEYL